MYSSAFLSMEQLVALLKFCYWVQNSGFACAYQVLTTEPYPSPVVRDCLNLFKILCQCLEL